MGRVVPLARGRRKRSRSRYARTRPLVSRSAWVPWAVIAGIAIAGGALTQGEGLRLSGASPERVVTSQARFSACGRYGRTCVVDGDTIRYGGVRIRLAGINAPEVFSPRCAAEKALGERATRRLISLVNAGPFEIVRSGPRDEDRYGRKLRDIRRGGRSLGDVLVAEGLARPWSGRRRSWCA